MEYSFQHALHINAHTESWQTMGYRYSQEDRFFIAPLFNGHLCAVADGHAGAEVSDSIVEHLVADFSREYHKVFDSDPSRICLSPKEERMIIRRTIAKLIKRFSKHLSGSTLSLVYAHPIIIDGDKSPVVRVHAATVGDSPIAIWNGKRVMMMPSHSARFHKNDIEKFNDNIRRVREYRRNGKAIDNNDRQMMFASIYNGYVYANRSDWTSQGIAMTRAIGDKDFGQLLIRRADIRTYDIPLNGMVLLASDGILDSSSPEEIHKRCKTIIENLRADTPLDQISGWLGNLDDNTTMIAMRFNESASYWR